MKPVFVFLLLFVAGRLAAFLPDSTYRELVRKGSGDLAQTFCANSTHIAKGETNKLDFVVNIQVPGSDPDRMLSTEVNGKQPLLTAALMTANEAEWNSKLQAIYTSTGVEFYLLLINGYDIMMKATLEKGQTLPVSSLFKPGTFFDQNSNIQSLLDENFKVVNDIVSASAITQNNRSVCLFGYTQFYGAFWKNQANYGKYGGWYIKNCDPANTSTPELLENFADLLVLDLETRYRFVRPGGNFVEYVEEVINAAEKTAPIAKKKSRLYYTFNEDTVMDILRAFTIANYYEALSVQERLHVAGVLLIDNSLFDAEEEFLTAIIRHTPENQVLSLLSGFENQSPLNLRPEYTGLKTNTVSLIYRLMYNTDDETFLWGDDNYTDLIVTLTKLELSSAEAINYYWEDGNDSEQFKRMINWGTPGTPKVGDAQFEAELLTNGRIRVDKSVADSIITYPVYASGGSSGGGTGYTVHYDDASYPAYELNAFDIVVFTHFSRLTMLDAAGVSNGQPSLCPALFLKYATVKGNEQAMKFVAMVALDVLTIATGPLAFISAINATRYALAAYELFVFVGSSANLAVNVQGIQDPQTMQVVGVFNIIVATCGLTNLAVRGALFSHDWHSAAKVGAINSITQNSADDFIRLFDE
ncbi:MAG: hypothetical protein IM638_19915, partial [Bacteroidetes bacterium]|nr:hypothetical protein [Bacteroidota bacterium]